MAARQAPSFAHPRDGQRRRTRKAIVDAAATLIGRGASPSVADIAAAADVSRRTVYLYFPTLEQLLLDATLGLLTQSAVDQVLDSGPGDPDDVEATLDRTIRTLGELTADTLPLGRALIKLTVVRPAEDAAAAAAHVPRRGYRRVEWIERAIAPLRARLDADEFDRLVSGLSLVIGWEAFVVLSDVRGLPRAEQLDVAVWSARALVRAALHHPCEAQVDFQFPPGGNLEDQPDPRGNRRSDTPADDVAARPPPGDRGLRQSDAAVHRVPAG